MQVKIKCSFCGRYCEVSKKRLVQKKNRRALRFEAYCKNCKRFFYKERKFKGKSGR